MRVLSLALSTECAQLGLTVVYSIGTVPHKVVRGRTTSGREALAENYQEAGLRLRRWVESGMARSGIRSVTGLSRASRVTRNTLYAWYNGTMVPSPGALSRVAHAMGMSAADATLAWEGKEPLPDTTEAALREVGDHLGVTSEQLANLVDHLDVLAVFAARMERDQARIDGLIDLMAASTAGVDRLVSALGEAGELAAWGRGLASKTSPRPIPAPKPRRGQ